MYSIQTAAAVLGMSEQTIRNWIRRYGMKKVVVETDRRRVYIADDDMATLVEHKYKIAPKHYNKPSNAGKTEGNKKKIREMVTIGDGKYYSLASVASLLGVSVFSVKRWIRQDIVEKKSVKTDRKRDYIARDDVLRLAELHGYTVSPKMDEETDIQRDVNTMEHDMDKLCSIKEVTLCLDISDFTARSWIRQANMEQKTKSGSREIACITYGDVVRLAELHRCAIVHTPSLTVREEVKEMKGKIETLAADIEDIKHDLRLLAKRSIYIG